MAQSSTIKRLINKQKMENPSLVSKNMSLIVDRSYNDSSILTKEPSVYTPSELSERFEKLRFAGSGGEGCIYEVNDNTTSRRKALKIASNNWRISEENQRVAKIVSAILKQGISPHLTQIYELLTVECPVFAKSAGNKTTGFFDGQYEGGEGKGNYPRRAFLMEILEGDLQKIYDKNALSREQSIVLAVHIASIQLILNQQGVIDHESGKYRNILYKILGPEDAFQGKAMIDYDFWKYVFGEHTLYLPRPKYLIKLADYDPWQFGSEDTDLDPEKFLENKLKYEGLTLIDLKGLFKKPEDPNAKILVVYDSSKTKFVNDFKT